MKALAVFLVAVLGFSLCEGSLIRCKVKEQLQKVFRSLPSTSLPNGVTVDDLLDKIDCQEEETSGLDTSAVNQMIPKTEGTGNPEGRIGQDQAVYSHDSPSSRLLPRLPLKPSTATTPPQAVYCHDSPRRLLPRLPLKPSTATTPPQAVYCHDSPSSRLLPRLPLKPSTATTPPQAVYCHDSPSSRLLPRLPLKPSTATTPPQAVYCHDSPSSRLLPRLPLKPSTATTPPQAVYCHDSN
ncbi:hypothetical protein Q5P01_025703 [Channa striata]|uniref:Uncharacterized protein n=1 Tax=Channa striata TaxID=64152 RepID=A0AA88IJ02_CHASR|nr:hypothetical protein Q5P01_025703 [Channa striata]